MAPLQFSCMFNSVNLDFVTKQYERARSREILEKCRNGVKYFACAAPASPPPPPSKDFFDKIKNIPFWVDAINKIKKAPSHLKINNIKNI